MTTNNSQYFFTKLRNNELDENLIESNKNLIDYNMINYTFGKRNYNLTKILLKNVENDLPRICRMFLYVNEFDEYKSLLIDYLDIFKNIEWIHVNIQNLSQSSIQFLIENYDKFEDPIPKNYLLYLNLILNDELIEIPNNIDLRIIEQYCIEHGKLDILQKIVDNTTDISSKYNLLNFSGRIPVDSIKWLMNFLLQNKNEFEDESYKYIVFDMFHCIIKTNNTDLLELFFNKFDDFIEPNIRGLYDEMKLSARNPEIFKYFIDRFPSLFAIFFENHKNDITYLHSFIYDYLYDEYKISFTEKIFWDLLSHKPSYHQYDFIKEIFEKYPNLEIKDMNNLHKCYIKDVRILDFFENKYPQSLKNIIHQILENSFSISLFYLNDDENQIKSLNEYQIINWCFDHYNITFNLDIDILNIHLFQLYEQKFQYISIEYYDKVIKRCAKLGLEELMNYIIQKFPIRYKIFSTQYTYVPYHRDYVKTFTIIINIINKHLTSSDSHECIICLDHHDKIYKTKCNHQYCLNCFHKWFKNKNELKCVYCRQKFLEVDLIKKISN
jgi:hypothetical protein